ncbi:MAG: hypothetical protein ACI4TU_08780 [Candidatus Cryptobacteroides sp.]
MKAKMLLLGMIVFLTAELTVGAQLVERTYIVTDRQVYVSGEEIFCSLFCFDAMKGGLSDFSSIAYMELVSPQGSAVRSKVALRGGRGAGRLRIPSDFPTGNYRLIAYTAQNRNEDGLDPFISSRILSIYNTLSSSRSEGTRLESEADGNLASPDNKAFAASSNDYLEITPKGDTLLIRSLSSNYLDFSLSLSIRDGIPDPQGPSLEDFMDYCDSEKIKEHHFQGTCIPEYEGEILSIKVSPKYDGVQAFLSSPGSRTDIYTSRVDSTGLVSFFTGNVYGDRDLVFELYSPDVEENFSYEVLSPFLCPELSEDNVPELVLSESMRDDLIKRSIYMQIGRHFGCEEFTCNLPVRPDLLFLGLNKVVYEMDHYTRFPTMRETITEYVRELSVRKQDGKTTIKVSPVKDHSFSSSLLSGTALVLVDGVIVSDHSLVLDLDPGLLKRIDIYPYDVSTGSYITSGVVNFISFKSDMAGCKLPSNVRMLGFQGAPIPVCIGPGKEDSLSPDYRYTRIWQPLLRLSPEEEMAIPLGHLPQEELRLVIEGLCGRKAFQTSKILNK